MPGVAGIHAGHGPCHQQVIKFEQGMYKLTYSS
jgi:hypothetical protein